MDNKHIKENSIIEHLAKARQKGYLASVELHNYGFSSKLFCFTDAFRDGIVLFSLILLILNNILWPIATGFVLWRGLKITLQSFNRLDRLHFLIREEKYEIDHHRDEEKQELMAIYAAKGFKGPILEEVIATLMADDNRLLQIMLEEELGVSFETLDHPVISGLISTMGAAAAVLTTLILSHIPFGLIVGSTIIISLVAIYESKKQRLPALNNLVWSIASIFFVFAIAYFVNKLLPTESLCTRL